MAAPHLAPFVRQSALKMDALMTCVVNLNAISDSERNGRSSWPSPGTNRPLGRWALKRCPLDRSSRLLRRPIEANVRSMES